MVIFATAALAIIPIAGILGEATEALAAKTGPQIGGLLNASLGNAAELIITLVAIQAGSIELVRASIIGSFLGNLLFVLGLSMLLGDSNMVCMLRPEPHGDGCHDDDPGGHRDQRPVLFQPAIEPDFQRVECLSLTTAASSCCSMS